MPVASKGARTRQKIVADAAAVFNRSGYEGSSLSDLMQATGLKKGGIYRHFSSKEELAAEAFDYTWAAARQAREPDVDQNTDPVGWIRQLIANFVSRRSPVPGGCPILNTAIEADDGNPILRARVTKALKGWRDRLEAAMALAIEQGKFRSGVDATSVATIIIASLEGALMMARLERSEEPLLRVQAHLNAYLDQFDTRRARRKTR